LAAKEAAKALAPVAIDAAANFAKNKVSWLKGVTKTRKRGRPRKRAGGALLPAGYSQRDVGGALMPAGY
jgi:hypothetical protein